MLPRLGFTDCKFEKQALPSIWIHAVSVGETKAMVSLARELKHLFPKNPLIISSITETGHAEAMRSLPFADYHVYLPFDFHLIICKMIKNSHPGLVLLCESDFWLNFLFCSKKRGAALALVNGKMSNRSMKRFRLVQFFSKTLFGLFDILCVQNDLYKGRFREAGATLEKISVTGNLKFDEEYPHLSTDEIIQWRQTLGIQPDQLVLTIGSTHTPEEQFFIQVLKQIWKNTPQLKVILVPRRPERFKEVAHLLEKEGISSISFTDINQRSGNEEVILIDAMGLLRMCYQLSDFAIVGGSFTEHVGGHNILEPCWYGIPVLFGSHMYSQLELVDLLTKSGGGIQVDQENLKSVLERWIANSQERREIGARGLSLVKDLKGSTERTLEVLRPLFSKLQVNASLVLDQVSDEELG